jgi:protease-4
VIGALLRNLFVNGRRALHNALVLLFGRGRRVDFVRIEIQGDLPLRRERRRVPRFLRRFFPPPPPITFEEIDRVLGVVEKDPRARGVLLVVGPLRMGWGKLGALRARLWALREAGKELAVHVAAAGNPEYYLASAGSRIGLSPAGSLWLTGLAAEVRFYKDALEKISTRAEVVGAGRYKTAFDPFVRSEMTPEHREAVEAILDDLSGELSRAIAQGRGMEEKAVQRLIDQGPYRPAQAEAARLVDAVAYEEEFEKRLGDQVRVMPFDRYLRIVRRPYEWVPLLRRPVLGFVDVSGILHTGKSTRAPLRGATAGHETVCKALEAARKNRRVRAVILHVDSRGGSGLAADLIWHEVRRLREAKPVVAYMGDVAASGGYYVACAADRVIASPTTLTGSIGVLAGKLNVSGLLSRLGVRTEVLKRGASADLLSPSRGFTAEERERMEQHIRAFYDDFVDRVAHSRDLPREKVAEAAEGRVWTGLRAAGLGLVDELGTFARAVECARERAGIRPGAYAPLVRLGREPAMPTLPGDGPWLGALEEAIGALGALDLLAGDAALCLWPLDVRVR